MFICSNKSAFTLYCALRRDVEERHALRSNYITIKTVKLVYIDRLPMRALICDIARRMLPTAELDLACRVRTAFSKMRAVRVSHMLLESATHEKHIQ